MDNKNISGLNGKGIFIFNIPYRIINRTKKCKLMEGILRFEQATDSWFIEHEEHFRILKDGKGQAYGAETTTKSIQVEPHSCPGIYPTDILNHDGMKVDFEVVTLTFGESEHDIKEGDFAKINSYYGE